MMMINVNLFRLNQCQIPCRRQWGSPRCRGSSWPDWRRNQAFRQPSLMVGSCSIASWPSDLQKQTIGFHYGFLLFSRKPSLRKIESNNDHGINRHKQWKLNRKLTNKRNETAHEGAWLFRKDKISIDNDVLSREAVLLVKVLLRRDNFNQWHRQLLTQGRYLLQSFKRVNEPFLAGCSYWVYPTPMKVMRSIYFCSMNFLQIWHKESLCTPDLIFDIKGWGHRVRFVAMVTGISCLLVEKNIILWFRIMILWVFHKKSDSSLVTRSCSARAQYSWGGGGGGRAIASP